MSQANQDAAPMDASHDERDVCENILSSVMEDIIAHLAAAANAQGGTLTAADIEETGRQFIAGKGAEFRLELRDHIHQSIVQHERELWDQTRKRPFDRMLVKRFSHLFPSENKLEKGTDMLSRRMLPGFFMAIEMMAGPELFEQCQRACKGRVRARKEDKGDDFLWRDFYGDAEANELVNDMFAVIALHFSDFEKRSEWLLNLLNSHLAPAEDYAFEGKAVSDWQMDEASLTRLLQALFSVFHQRFGTEDGRRRIVQRYGDRLCQSIEHILENLYLAP